MNKFNTLNINHIPKKSIIVGEDIESLNNYLFLFLAKINCVNFNSLNHEINKCLFCQKILNYELINIKYLGDFKKNISKQDLLNFIFDSNYFHLFNLKQVYVINGLEKLNEIAQNSILKWVEDLNKDTYLIFLCLNWNNVLQTLKSRLIRFDALNLNYSLTKENEENKKNFELFFNFLNPKNKNQIFLLYEKLINLANLKEFLMYILLKLETKIEIKNSKTIFLVQNLILEFINNFLRYKPFRKIYILKLLNSLHDVI